MIREEIYNAINKIAGLAAAMEQHGVSERQL